MCIRDRGVFVEEDALRYIAQNINQNVRELEGALNRVIAYCDFRKIPANLSNTEKILNAVSYTHLRAHETVLDLVCRLLLEKKKITHNKDY